MLHINVRVNEIEQLNSGLRKKVSKHKFRVANLAVLLLLILSIFMVRESRAEWEKLPNVVIAGNEIVPTEMLCQVLCVTRTSEITRELAARVRREMLQYYYKRGYTLARVWTKIHEKKLFISVDEGKLDKVIIRGRGSAISVLIKWLLDIPYDVYNKGLVESQLAAIQKRLGLGHVSHYIIRSEKKKDVGFQLSDWGVDIFQQKRALFEMHIQIAKTEGTGPGFGVQTVPGLGVVPSVSYTARGVFFDDAADKVKLRLRNGYDLRKRINGSSRNLSFTHVQGYGRYDFPAIKDLVRFYSEDYVEMSSYKRPDLPLDEYWRFVVHASLNVAFDIDDTISIWLGGGVEYINIFSIRHVPEDTFEMEPFDNRRFFGGFGLDFNFSPEELRLDRLHTLNLKYEFYSLKVSKYHRVSGLYHWLKPVGYDDMIVQLKMTYTIGSTPFYEEVPIGGKLMRNFFKGDYYIDRAGWASFEYRFSLWKDILKVSLYGNVAGFGQIAHDKDAMKQGTYTDAFESDEAAFAVSGGPGFHWLILDIFQFDIYACFGWAPNGYEISYFFEFMKVYL